MDKSYIAVNRKQWNARTEAHLTGEFYQIERFKAGWNSLNAIELDLLGDVRGQSILHLQCHFGQDTLSLARMGAKVTGVDLSDRAIDAADALKDELGLNATFLCCDLFDLPQHLDQKFDIVFTSYGTIGWLPELDTWGKLIQRYLKPEGRFVFAEFHPVVWMFSNDFSRVGYNYFNDGPIVESTTSTYGNDDAVLSEESYGWNHALSGVLQALMTNGLVITQFAEFDTSPYNCFQGMVCCDEGYFVERLGRKLPLVYALTATHRV